jgi:hypothetical protein
LAVFKAFTARKAINTENIGKLPGLSERKATVISWKRPMVGKTSMGNIDE